ncbi:hypothetical protein K502DRAFT_324968 [Neoconidiobolus thromboides FSU 785]|nr:hypothetical protein K502DRAFT_324968 [Neoconidiobolus thromboides FSU 785]
MDAPILMAGQTKYRRKFDDLVTIIEGDNLSTKLYSLKEFKKGEEIALLKGLTVNPVKDYTTVQTNQNVHVDLDSEFVFTNHSCNPSVNFVAVADNTISVTANKDIQVNDELTFFYPSTEYSMDQPFDCWCGDSKVITIVNVYL